MQTARVGERVPDFELDCITSDGQQNTIDAQHLQGSWTVLLFYPRDFSFICPTEIIAFSSRIEDFRERNCRVLGISIDDLQTHARWFETAIADGGVGPLRYPLAADTDGAVTRRFGVWSERLALAHRALFLIDPDGVIQFSLVHGPKVGRNVDEVLRVLDALNSGGLCPASWTAADGTLNVEELLKPGRTLGHFRIERELGSGSFGSVVEANDLRLQRQVALKILRKNRGSMTRNQMLNEARGAAVVSHPNVCTVFSVDEIDGLPVIVMELLDGRPLSELLGQPWDAAEQTRLMRQSASGLAAAHAAGVVHGDLKPANIILAEDRPVIVDFGLSFPDGAFMLQGQRTDGDQALPSVDGGRATDLADLEEIPVAVTATADSDAQAELKATDSWTLAQSGSGQGKLMAGTFAYMAPELLFENRKDQQSDVFSLGLIFLEVITGKRDWLGQSVREIAANLKRIDLADFLCRDLESPFSPTLRRMLSRRPEERPAAADIETELSATAARSQ